MYGVPGQLTHRRVMQFTPTFRAEYAERIDKDGNPHIAVKLVNDTEDGRHQEFWTDLDRLDEVLRRADAHWRDRQVDGAERHTERIGRYMASFSGWPPHDPTERVAVHLSQTNQDGVRQQFTIDSDRLKSAVAYGQEVEQALGYNRRWHTLVYYESVANGFDGQTRARVFQSVENEREAGLLLARNKGLALVPDETRRPLRRGEEIDLWPETTVRLSNGYTKSVPDLVASNQQSRELIGDHFVVASWNDVSRPPVDGSRVIWEGSNSAFNGEPSEFRARPVGAGEPGEPKEAMYVLIRREDSRIQAFSPSRKEMVAELDRVERLRRELTVDWDQQTFQMDRRKYGMDPSM